MSYGTNNREKFSYGTVTDANYRRFREEMGLPATEAPERPTLSELRSVVTVGDGEEFARMGEELAGAMSAPLDADLLDEHLAALAEGFDRFDELRETGAPEYGETPYTELAEPGWAIDEHLTETGFYEAAEQVMPAFEPELIEATTRRLLTSDSLAETLSTLGFPAEEQAALVTNIVNSSDRLSWWGAGELYPEAEEQKEWSEDVVPDYVSPLQKRAVAGSLLWTEGLDWRLWQYEVLLTDDVIEKGVWDVKSMLAGVYLMGDAARRLATGDVDDEELATVVTASSAVMLIGQELIADDVARLTDEQRRPREETSYEGVSWGDER